jgi:hypothetical protein
MFRALPFVGLAPVFIFTGLRIWRVGKPLRASGLGRYLRILGIVGFVLGCLMVVVAISVAFCSNSCGN